MEYWFLRMRQGSKGPDFTKELWQRGLVGILWGAWTINDVLSDIYPTRLDERKLTPQRLNAYRTRTTATSGQVLRLRKPLDARPARTLRFPLHAACAQPAP